jgi:hypothetical protein
MESVIEKIIQEQTETASTYSKLTILYQLLNHIQKMINELESKLPPEEE